MATKGSIPKSFIESLLQRVDIVPIISQRVSLKKAGATYKACCPFHDEKTPSFNVNPSKQFYHCFGCGASGDAIKFLMEYDGLSFVEAVESLAAQNGMQVPREQRTPEQARKQAQREQQAQDYYSLMHLAAKFYRHQLRDHPESQSAKQYLKERGLTSEIATKFVIGFAPDGWDNLRKAYQAQPGLQGKLVELGMLVQKEDGKSYDRFRQRIMFPIRDGRGRVIAFGGRVLGEGTPKYLNSPETPIFHKSNVLYGLYEMRQSREKFSNILVVEGYMDVVALAQFGISNAVATLGTAFTPEHTQLLFRQVSEVVFCFDGDAAGMKAAWKAVELMVPLMEKERSVRFLFLAQGEDPDTTVRKEGQEAFKARINNAMPLSDFIRQHLLGRLGNKGMDNIEARQQFVALAEPLILSAQGLYQYLLVEMVANQVQLPAWRLEKQLNIRTGYAQGHQPKRQAAQTGFGQAKVLSVPIKLVAYLQKYPHWHKVFLQDFIADLHLLNREDVRFLHAAIELLRLNANHLSEFNLAQNLQAQGFTQQVTLIKTFSFVGEERIQMAEGVSAEQVAAQREQQSSVEFMALLKSLLLELEEARLEQTDFDVESLKKIYALQKGESLATPEEKTEKSDEESCK